MESSQSKLPIYLIILCSLLWLFFVLYWMLSEQDTSVNNQIEAPIQTNNIISMKESLPVECTQALNLLNCVISWANIGGDKQWINEYYQKLISERNIINDIKLLKSECTKQYNYIQSIQNTWYQQIIQSCNK